MPLITTSLVIDFDAGEEGGILTAEIDDRTDGYNTGNTSFVPGDSPAFLVYKTTNVVIDGIDQSEGAVNIIAAGSIDVEEYLTFANEREASPSKPISSAFSSKWVGRDGGIVTQTESKITVPTPTVAALKITYKSNFTAYRLTGVPLELDGETSFPIIIYIAGTSS